MLMLLDWPWVWIGVGVVLFIWGNGFLKFGWREWVSFLFDWFGVSVSDETAKERSELKKRRFDEEVVGNPGCGLVLLGGVLIGYGVLRLFMQ